MCKVCRSGRRDEPPSTCPTLKERLEGTKPLRDIPLKGVKKIIRLEEPNQFLIDEDMAVPRQIYPPSTRPSNGIIPNITVGKIFVSYDSKRQRRELYGPHISISKGYPEIDLIGELKVLDTVDDVMCSECKIASTDCISPFNCSLAAAAVLIIPTIAATVILVLIRKSNNFSNKIIRFQN
ncbi:hypothetical protein DICVIV_08129 [Dictyocaulus viviparus]|uniref:Uncharacterized protein n=1 Tax=Dictyocaulus viviparus TaxID=29172 RepID=A0A0D8XTY6_DICVI|nr:hypothetical protein DICVIV_08129 [Dictyocaulus viviparus]